VATATFGADVNIIFDSATGNLWYDNNGGNSTNGRSLIGHVTVGDGGTFDFNDVRVGP
jgi:hypothetical protein